MRGSRVAYRATGIIPGGVSGLRLLIYIIIGSGLLLLIAPADAAPPAPAGQSGSGALDAIYFDDSGPAIILGNGYYEVGFRKGDGSIAYITDKATNQHVTDGSRGQCLWWAQFRNADGVGGCPWAGGYQFTYAWTPPSPTASGVLSFHYTSAAAQRVAVQVDIHPSPDHWFDMQLDVQNQQGDVLTYVQFPSDLLFAKAGIQQALLPVSPGIALESGFFSQGRSYTTAYPGNGTFADYMSVVSTRGKLALYALYGQGPIKPVDMGFIDDEQYNSGETYYYHAFAAEAANNTSWSSPQVRMHIGRDPMDTIEAYRDSNGLGDSPSLRQKLGWRYGQLVRSPLYKVDADQLVMPYAQYATELLAQVPVPGLLHLVAYWPGGFDENYPDFLPPSSRWGAGSDFRAMLQSAHGLGFSVVPYINPTWWDDESPTLRDAAAPPITSTAALDAAYRPVYECYPSPNPAPCTPANPRRDSEWNRAHPDQMLHGGYVMSPYSIFVQERLHSLIVDDWPAYPFDYLFEDQVGARRSLLDYNASSPGPLAYVQGWIAHTDAYSNTGLMTEQWFDRLTPYEIGVHGSALLDEKKGAMTSTLGTGTWQYVPLAPRLARDKVLFYQHDLAPETMTTDTANLTWNLAFGYMLSYDLGSAPGAADDPWLKVVGAFQHSVISRYADARLDRYSYLSDNATQTVFGSYTVTANWDQDNPYNTGQYTLSAPGVMVTNTDGTLIAGVFTGYNGSALSGGEQYLIEERNANDIVLRHPQGMTTTITLKLLPVWTANSGVEVWAFAANGQRAGQLPASLAADSVTFELSGPAIAYYKVLVPNRVYLPLVASVLN